MQRVELIFMDAKSSKFWHIELADSSHTVTYGRVGTDGQTKTKEFDSAEKAQASYDKLIKQKMSKGYVEANDSSTADNATGNDSRLPLIAFTSIVKQDDLHSNVSTFVGKRVADYDPEKGAAQGGKTIYRFRSDWENDSFHDDLQHFLDSEAAAEATGIVLGNWAGEAHDTSSEDAIERLADAQNQLPNLAAIYLGDIVSEENEISWIVQSDLSPLLDAFPQLQLLRTRGGNELEISDPSHDNLRALALETGGLSANVVRSICTSEFLELEHLELWLGTEEYGGDSTVQDLQPILSGALFPKLKYLGLRNCQYTDDIAGVIVNSPIIEQIETLDLSLGVLTDVGAQALLSLPDKGNLKKVSIHHHFASKSATKKLKDLKINFDTSGQQEGDDEWRFVAVGE